MAVPELYELKMKTGEPKALQVKHSGAKIVATACENCKLQLKDLNNYYNLGVKIVGVIDPALKLSKKKELYRIQAKFCKALAHPTRLEIIDHLFKGEKTVSELVRLTELPQPTASQHLAFLRQLNIVRTRRKGSNVYYSLAYPELKTACNTIREVIIKILKELPSVLEEK